MVLTDLELALRREHTILAPGSGPACILSRVHYTCQAVISGAMFIL